MSLKLVPYEPGPGNVWTPELRSEAKEACIEGYTKDSSGLQSNSSDAGTACDCVIKETEARYTPNQVGALNSSEADELSKIVAQSCLKSLSGGSNQDQPEVASTMLGTQPDEELIVVTKGDDTSEPKAEVWISELETAYKSNCYERIAISTVEVYTVTDVMVKNYCQCTFDEYSGHYTPSEFASLTKEQLDDDSAINLCLETSGLKKAIEDYYRAIDEAAELKAGFAFEDHKITSEEKTVYSEFNNLFLGTIEFTDLASNHLPKELDYKVDVIEFGACEFSVEVNKSVSWLEISVTPKRDLMEDDSEDCRGEIHLQRLDNNKLITTEVSVTRRK